ncbi:MAG: hypothetical protein Q9227_004162 [Pyrenula ochraceoflavens]
MEVRKRGQPKKNSNSTEGSVGVAAMHVDAVSANANASDKIADGGAVGSEIGVLKGAAKSSARKSASTSTKTSSESAEKTSTLAKLGNAKAAKTSAAKTATEAAAAASSSRTKMGSSTKTTGSKAANPDKFYHHFNPRFRRSCNRQSSEHKDTSDSHRDYIATIPINGKEARRSKQ